MPLTGPLDRFLVPRRGAVEEAVPGPAGPAATTEGTAAALVAGWEVEDAERARSHSPPPSGRFARDDGDAGPACPPTWVPAPRGPLIDSVRAATTAGRAARPALACTAAHLAASRTSAGLSTVVQTGDGAGAVTTSAAPPLAFDRTGELLAVGGRGRGGGVAILAEADLRAWWEGREGGPPPPPPPLAPILTLRPRTRHSPRVLAWDGAPGRDDWLGTIETEPAGGACRLALWDLRVCDPTVPSRALSAGPGGGGGGGPGAGGSLTTLAPLGSASGWAASTWAAGDAGGAVRVWDGRAPGDRPVAWLVAGGGGGGGPPGRGPRAVTALAALHGSPAGAGPPLILAGAGLDGTLLAWDVRGGRGEQSAALGSAGLGLGGLPPLAAFPLSPALARVPGLAAQAGPSPGACPIVSLHGGAGGGTAAAVHLDCGWSARLEVGARGGARGGPPARVTHLHAPPEAAGPARTGVDRRRPAWAPGSGAFVVPRPAFLAADEGGCGGSQVFILDFGAGRASPLCVWRGDDEGDENASPSPTVCLHAPATRVAAVAVHPRTGEVVGGEGGVGGGGCVRLQFFRGGV